MFDLLLLAQDSTALDPTAIGDKLGKAQDVQEILGIIVGVLIVVVVALVTWYLRERKAWGIEKLDLIKRWGDAKLEWEVERGKHAGQLTEVAEAAADSREGLMREMLDLSLRIEKALNRLAEWKEARDQP